MPPPEEKRITMREMAHRLGLNPSTVSRALQNHPHVAATTKEKVKAAAQELGYREDPALKSLVGYRWHRARQSRLATVAVLLDQTEAELARSGESADIELTGREAVAMGYALERYFLREHASPEALSRILYHRGIQGVLIGRTTRAYDARRFLFDWNAFSAVAVNVGITAFPCHSVMPNQFNAVLRLLRTLAKAGYQRIGAVLRNDLRWRTHLQEIGAFRYSQLNFSAASRIPICFDDPEAHPQKVLQWFRKSRPDVIIGCDVRTLAALRSGGVRMPEDVCFAALELEEESSGAGFGFVGSCFAEAMVQLDSLLRLNRRGIPDERHTTLITPHWLPGDTLPGVNALVY